MTERRVAAHIQHEVNEYEEIVPEHIDRAEASQTVFNAAKRYLEKLFGGKRCIVCEMRGERPEDYGPHNHIESHHMVEWSHWNQIKDWSKVELLSRLTSPLIHGWYLISKEDILAGKPLPSLWDRPEWQGKPLTTLDDPRLQWFLCLTHHQQATKEIQALGHDGIGVHHLAVALFFVNMVLDAGDLAARHVDHHALDGLDRRV